MVEEKNKEKENGVNFNFSVVPFGDVNQRRDTTSLAEDALDKESSITYDPPKRVVVPRVVNRHNLAYTEQLESLTDDKGAKPVWKLIRDMYERGALANTIADDREYDYNGEPNLADEGIDFQGMEFDDLQRLNKQLQSVIKQKTAAVEAAQKAQAEAVKKARQTRENPPASDAKPTDKE